MSEQKELRVIEDNLRLFYQEFVNESDRASVILAVAMFEEALRALLCSRFVPIASEQDHLFDAPYAPLSSYSAKIDIAFRIGLISRRMSRALHLIRRMRNDFAHRITGCTFEDASVRSRIAELAKMYHKEISIPEEDMPPGIPEGPRRDFLLVASWVLARLWGMVRVVEPLTAAEQLMP